MKRNFYFIYLLILSCHFRANILTIVLLHNTLNITVSDKAKLQALCIESLYCMWRPCTDPKLICCVLIIVAVVCHYVLECPVLCPSLYTAHHRQTEWGPLGEQDHLHPHDWHCSRWDKHIVLTLLVRRHKNGFIPSWYAIFHSLNLAVVFCGNNFHLRCL